MRVNYKNAVQVHTITIILTFRMPQTILKTIFGYDSFRPLQEEIINKTIDGCDSVVIMPTGGGKSLCYQIPALYLDGCAIVISPLISLMQDQVMALQELGVNAMLWNSTLSYAEVQHVEYELTQGRLKLLYVSPERLNMETFFNCISNSKISFFAIDEAHCISEWGHDFRPGYRTLHTIRETMPDKPIMALTATATERVITDIKSQLNLYESNVYKASFNRPNLYYEVRRKKNTMKQLLNFLNERHNQSGIIYCQSRKSVETLADKLMKQGFNAKPYHAGLSLNEREQNQQDFIHDKASIIVATIAFGMGINKSNVRYVVHYDLPKTIENYYQETGRAGRDGIDSHCLLFFSYADRHKYETFLREIPDEKERKHAFTKLNLMLNFAGKPRCRRAQLLAYFDENPDTITCNTCDICKHPPEETDITVASQKILSCIYRVNQNYGMSMIVDILKGVTNDRLSRLGFDRLSTFGIETDLNKSQLLDVIQHLIFLRKILIVGDDYPVLKLNESAWPILRGEESLSMPIFEAIKSPSKKRTSKTNTSYTEDPNLLDALKTLRKEIARKQRVPAYIIFHDKTLLEMASIKPTTMSQLLTITGVGERKAKIYGTQFLEFISTFSTSHAVSV